MKIAESPSADRTSTIARAASLLRRNELVEAGALLTQALAKTPDDPALLHILGSVRRLERQPAKAEELYRRSLAAAAAQPTVHRDLGKLLASLGRMDEAIAELRTAKRLKPDDDDANLCLAAALARRGDHAAAVTDYGEILRRQPGHIVARLGLAEALCNLGRAGEAERILREAPAIREPALAAVFAHRLGIALKQQKKYSQALALFEAAQVHKPDFPGVDFIRGETLQQMGLWEQAALSFRKVLARQPGHANAAGSLALISALSGDFVEAHEWGTKTLAHAPAHPVAHIALAITEIEAGDFPAAAQRLRDLLENPEAEQSEGTAIAAGFAADAFDRHGLYHNAFAVSRASKTMLRNLWPLPARGKRATDTAREITNYFEVSEPWTAGSDPGADAERPNGHVFVLGFLRSGTTLLETILATDSNVIHAHEIDFLGAAARQFLMDGAGLDRLAAQSDEEIAAWRERYWMAVRAANFAVDGKIFVDKMPINTFRLPLIARLFPSAKIILTIRDPRDVVLSCFRHHFDPTPYSMEFLRLEDCARLYAASMALADVCRRKLPLDILELRYEDLIGDFAATAHELCRFSGITWNDTMRDFRQAAETIDLRSASARQVRRGLYTDAVGHWRHYREELAPVMPILAPWVARFGYPEE
jgi:Flp pilus assembly protein TadD